jgi:ribonuclease HII
LFIPQILDRWKKSAFRGKKINDMLHSEMMLLGVDEAGRGPAMGPLVVAGVLTEDEDRLGKMGVKDSKVLSEMRRGELFKSLARENYHCILEVPARVIDLVRETMTMNRLEVLCFATVIASLHRGEKATHPDLPDDITVSIGGSGDTFNRVILDAADVRAERFGDEVLETVHQIEDIGGIGFLSKHKADRDHPVVGAASILAKVTRDRRISEIAVELGEEIGSGYPSDPITRSFLKEYVGRNGTLPEHARTSWETCRKLLDDKQQRSLLDF